MLLLYLLIPFAIPAALIALVWVCARSVAQEKEIKRLRQDLNDLSAGMHGKELDFSVPPSAPTAAPTPTYVPPVRQTPPNPQPAAPSAAPSAARTASQPVSQPVARTAKVPAEKPARTLENWLGRNVLGVVASLLVFIGLIFLGVLVYKNITDSIKILLMYALSTLLTGLGVFLATKSRNNFTLALTGCGCGSFFISILLTHVYFGMLPDLAAFGLLLLWMAVTLVIARRQRSTLLSVVGHAGMIISLCFAFSQGISDQKLLLVLLYQVAMSAVMLAGNVFCCRKTYHFGVFASLGLTLVASGFMNERFVLKWGVTPFHTSLPTPAIAAAFALQFLMASVFSYLLAISASRMKNENAKVALHLFNKLLWAAALYINVYVTAYRLALPHFVSDASDAPARLVPVVGIAIAACFVPLLLHVIVSLTMQIKLRFSEALERVSVLTCFVLTAVFLLVFWRERAYSVNALPRLPWLVVPALALLLVRRFSRQSAYLIGANVLLGLDFLFALFGGYGRLVAFGSPLVALEWMLLYLAIIVGQWFFRSPAERKKYSAPVRMVLYLVGMPSLLVILCNTTMPYPGAIILSILTGLHFLLLLLRYDREEREKNLAWLLGAASLLLLVVDAWYIAFANRRSSTELGVYFLLAVLAFFLAAVRTPRLFYYKDRPLQGVLTGIVLTLLVLATVNGNTDWFGQSYLLSLTGMLTALACILAGFIGRVSSLRFYGLILTLVCVLKLVTLDVIGLVPVLRVIALIGGGIICFIVSAIYNYTVKQLKLTKVRPSEAPHKEDLS